ncbi:MAG: hypothetical protein MJZ10_02050 [Fibrobacter sp.]|nr:hypothetical protein [Fibrobacter sp.]
MVRSFFYTLLILSIGVFAADVSAPKGNVRNATVNDFMPHQATTKEFNETWSYQFVFDNGTRAFVNFGLMHIPGTGRKNTTEMSFWNFKGKSYTIGRQYPPERLQPIKEKNTINIKNEYLMENKPGKGHRVLFTADKNGKWFLDLTFESAEQGKVLGDGVWKVGNEKFGQYIHIPYGRVSGRIGYNEDTLTVKGYAYMDQTWQTVQATDLAIRSVNFSTNSRSPLYAGRISMTKDGKLLGYAIYNGAEGTKVVTPKEVKEGEAAYNGKDFPKGSLNFLWNEENVPQLQFNAAKPFQKASILDKVDGWFAKKAFKIAAGGEVFFYRGRSDLNSGKKLDWCITGAKD